MFFWHPGGQAEAAEEAAAAPLAVSVSQRWEAEHGVVGLAWLDGPVLALLLEHGPRTLLHLYNQQGKSSSGLSCLATCLGATFTSPGVLAHFCRQHASELTPHIGLRGEGFKGGFIVIYFHGECNGIIRV